MFINRFYSSEIERITSDVLRFAKKVKNPLINPTSKTKNNKNLYIIVSSTLGLCGAYNTNIFKIAEVSLKSNDEAIILGKKGLSHFEDGKFTLIEDFSTYHSISDQAIIRQLTNFVIGNFTSGRYQEIHLIYSSFKNSFVFLAKDVIILPVKKPLENSELEFSPILEPTPQKLVDSLLPLYLKSTIYSKLLESEVCEHAARRNAMENATENAEELLDNLHIEFNKARQASITQEITEIVASAKAL